MFLLAGCYPSNTNTPASSAIAPTQTNQPLPTFTKLPPIQPTITTFPTLTITPNIPLSECPKGNLQLEPDFSEQLLSEFPRLGEPILEFLNNGGTPQAVISSLSWTEEKGLSPDRKYDSSIRTEKEFNQTHLFQKDITNDGISEFIVSRVNLYIFGCRNEKYEILLQLENDDWLNQVASPWIVLTDDINSNNVPELIIKSYYGKTGTAFRVLEWQEGKFANLLISETASEYFSTPDVVALPIGDVVIDDFDKNGTKDLAFRGFELFTNGLPSRGETIFLLVEWFKLYFLSKGIFKTHLSL